MSDTVILGDRTRSATDQETFQHLTERYRREIQLHCYRMLGSLHDAEDLVQETFLRAWRGRERFEGGTSFRSWLYRIATNACLNARRANARRVLPETLGPPADHAPLGAPETEIARLEPYPDAALGGIPDVAPGPDARYEMHEVVQFAFVAAIQELPPRQRAVLLLGDVLGWSARETAVLLDASVGSHGSISHLCCRRTTLRCGPPPRPSGKLNSSGGRNVHRTCQGRAARCPDRARPPGMPSWRWCRLIPTSAVGRCSDNLSRS